MELRPPAGRHQPRDLRQFMLPAHEPVSAWLASPVASLGSLRTVGGRRVPAGQAVVLRHGASTPRAVRR
jgi:hypothetical protein